MPAAQPGFRFNALPMDQSATRDLARNLVYSSQRSFASLCDSTTRIQAIQFSHLLFAELFQCQSSADIERRLVHIGDKEMRFCGVGNGPMIVLPMEQKGPWLAHCTRTGTVQRLRFQTSS